MTRSIGSPSEAGDISVPLKLAVVTSAIILAAGTSAATDLNNIENIRPSGTNPINITGELNMQNNNIDSIASLTGYYGGSCNAGNAMVSVNNDGSFECVDVTGEVEGDFVSRSGDSMEGNLDMQGNNILTTGNINGLDLDNPGNAISISGSQYIIPTGAIKSNELDETASYSLGWGNLAISQSDVSAADVGLGNVRNVDLSNTAGAYIAYDATNENYNVQAGNMGWADLAVAQSDVSASDVGLGNVENIALSNAGWADMGIAQSDITVADLGAADSNLNMNGYSITNYFGSSCNAGNVVVDISDDGTIDCTDATGEVSGDFVSRTGDSMEGNLDMKQNYLTLTNDDGDYYLGGGSTPDSETTGVHLEANTNPTSGDALFVVESSGSSERLRVEHSGTTSTSNTFEATGYTEAGSSTLSNDITGDSDTLDGNDGSYYLDNTDNQQLSISGDTISLGNGGSVTIQDDTIADNQNIQASRSGDTVTISIDNGNGASFTDNYEANTDNQQLSISGDTISLGNGGSVTIQDDDASTRCSGNDYLAGDGTCNIDSYQANTDNQGLSNVLSNGNTVGSTQTIDASSGAFRLPVGTDAY